VRRSRGVSEACECGGDGPGSVVRDLVTAKWQDTPPVGYSQILNNQVTADQARVLSNPPPPRMNWGAVGAGFAVAGAAAWGIVTFPLSAAAS